MDYAEIVATVAELVTEFGRSVTFEKRNGEVADPAKPWRGAAVAENAQQVITDAVFVPPEGKSLGLDFISPELLKKCTEVCLVAPIDGAFPLNEADTLLDVGVRSRIEWCAVLRPGPIPVLYAIGVTR